MESICDEITKDWSELDFTEQKFVILCHKYVFKSKGLDVGFYGWKKMFHLGNPKIVLGIINDEINYSRIHEDSIDVMKVIINNYLQEFIKN